MGFLQGLKDFIEIGAAYTSPKKEYSNAKVNEIHAKHQADKAGEMELIIEKETDPLIKKKLKRRLDSGIFEWEDLYQDENK